MRSPPSQLLSRSHINQRNLLRTAAQRSQRRHRIYRSHVNSGIRHILSHEHRQLPNPRQLPLCRPRNRLQQVFILRRPLHRPRHLIPTRLIRVTLQQFRVNRFLPKSFISHTHQGTSPQNISRSHSPNATRHRNSVRPHDTTISRPSAIERNTINRLTSRRQPNNIIPASRISTPRSRNINTANPRKRAVDLRPYKASATTYQSYHRERTQYEPNEDQDYKPPTQIPQKDQNSQSRFQ